MPELRNLTPYPNFRYYSRDNRNQEFGIVIVKATYELFPSGRLVEAEEQAPMMFTDHCHGAVNMSSLWHPSDLVPNKPATDVIVNGIARAPGGVPQQSWQCGISIVAGTKAKLSKRLTVTGPRQWNPLWKRRLKEGEARDWRNHRNLFRGWELSEPKPVNAVPLRYEYAYGGETETGTGEDGKPIFDTDQRNPLGIGKINAEWTDHTRPVAAPQIEAADRPIADPHMAHTPEGLGPIPPAWLPRRPLGGTYDQIWVDNTWPAWPADYSFAFHNSAHPDLIIEPYLEGTERVLTEGLANSAAKVEFDLPGEQLIVDFVREDGSMERSDMNLDTVFLDIAAPRIRDWRVYLSWRVNFDPNTFDEAIIHRRLVDASQESLRQDLNEGIFV